MASSSTLRQPQQGPSAFCSSVMSNQQFYWASTPVPTVEVVLSTFGLPWWVRW